VNKRQLNNGSWTKAANDRAFECAVLPRVFEIFYDGVGGKPRVSTIAARSPAPYPLTKAEIV
jgi:hypothetical protein